MSSTTFQDEQTNCVILNEDSPIVSQPRLIKTNLKQHQLALIKRCSELEKSSNKSYNINRYNIQTRIGVIGDIVGSGKTLSVLGLISNSKSIKAKIPKYFSNSHISYIDSTNSFDTINYNSLKNLDTTNVIIVPHNIYKQWSSTIEKETELKYIGIFNKKSFQKFEEQIKEEEFSPDIILISSTKFSEVVAILNNYSFSRLFIDEADSIKIKNPYFINYNFMWFITSTYDVLCNPSGKRRYTNGNGEYSNSYNPSNGFTNYIYEKGVESTYVKSILVKFNSIDSRIRKYLIIKNDNEFIKQAFSLKDYIVNILKSNNPLVTNIIGSFASKEIMDHINGGDIEGAIEKLNCKKISEKDLIEGVTKDFEDKLNNKKLEYEMKSQMTFSSPNAKKEALEKIKQKIQNFEIKIEGIKSKLNDNNRCSICYDDINNVALTMCCNTKFCLECISQWLYSNKSCPFCRATISNSNIAVITNKEKCIEKEIDSLKSKIDNLKQLIEDRKINDNFKMLIFSDYQNSFKEIVEFMDSTGIRHRKVIGTTATINKIINEYKLPNSNPQSIQVLLLNAEYCASGINLENTSDIVIYHSMNEAKTKQIIGRGQRPGRTSQLNVWKLCYINEL
jgi:hypothetical protein